MGGLKHDCGLMNNGNSFSSNVLRILKRISQNFLAGSFCNKFDALHDTRYNNMLNSTVFSLRVFTDENCVNICIRSFVADDRTTRTHVRKEGKCPSEG